MTDSTGLGKVPTPADVAAALGIKVDAANSGGAAESGGSPEAGKSEAGKVDAPWNDSDNPFDAERAARLIHNLREDNRALQQRLDERAQSAGSSSLEQRVENLSAENQELRSLVVDYQRARALNEAGIGEEFLDLVQGTTPEEVKHFVERLVALKGTSPQESAGGPAVAEPAQVAVNNEPLSTNDKWKRAFGF